MYGFISKLSVLNHYLYVYCYASIGLAKKFIHFFFCKMLKLFGQPILCSLKFHRIIVGFEIGKGESFDFILLFQDRFEYLDILLLLLFCLFVLQFHMGDRISLPIYVKKDRWTFDNDYLESVDKFWSIALLKIWSSSIQEQKMSLFRSSVIYFSDIF